MLENRALSISRTHLDNFRLFLLLMKRYFVIMLLMTPHEFIFMFRYISFTYAFGTSIFLFLSIIIFF